MAGVRWSRLLAYAGLTLLPVLFIQAAHLANNDMLPLPAFLTGWLGFILTILVGALGVPEDCGQKKTRLPYLSVLVAGLGLAAGLVYTFVYSTAVAWLIAAALSLVLIWVEAALFHGARWVWRLLSSLAMAGIFCFLLVGLWMIQSRFSEEEFFVAVQAGVLAVLWWITWAAVSAISKEERLRRFSAPGLTFNRFILYPLLGVVLLAAGVWVLNRYQASFYPSAIALTSTGDTTQEVSRQSPFLCRQAEPEGTVYHGRDVWQKYLERVEANPNKGAPEFGMLAVTRGEQKWADQFRTVMLQEAAANEFTGPSNSVKIGQYYAALRAYYYPQVQQAFPTLFSADDQRVIQAWFARINRRALTVEWVDWMYGVAFTRQPEGLYENQENGAGLLAVLEKTGLADPSLSPANRAYMQRNPRGWEMRFRNTDDAITYQPIWLNNAYFQWLYTGKLDSQNQRNSFDWLLNQAPPAGEDLQYNHPEPTTLAGAAYLGAALLRDPHYLWMAGKNVDYLAQHGGYLEAQPGMEQPVDFDGASPQVGSCLIYGDSGLPNQLGPLAPDKLVLRNGWQDDASYLLLNLRFTGWHRYKATNTVTLFNQGEPFAKDQLSGKRVAWLPYGRSHFRDKRIPRENLNGLSIERAGLSQVIHTLTGIGGRWEQDPPFYSQISDFQSGSQFDYVRSSLLNWHGWQQDRDIYAAKDGLTVVVDRVQGPVGRNGSIFWHLFGKPFTAERIALGSPATGAEALLIPDSQGQLASRPALAQENQPDLEVEYRLPTSGKGRLITVFLPEGWAGAQVQLEHQNGQEVLQVAKGSKTAVFPLASGDK